VKAKVVVVTGASAGVGRATVRQFARRGARLGLIARGRERLEATADEVERLGGQALVLPGDVSDSARMEEAAAAVEARYGPIDVWINNAMVSVFSPVYAMEAAEYRRVIEVTYLGVVHGTLAALRRMRPRDRGVIVQVGSALAYRAIPLQSAYCAAKHAVAGFTESLRTELLHDRSQVRLTIVHLPALNTPQFEWARSRLPRRAQPVPPIFQPEVAARAIVWASRHPRREVWVGGATVKAIIADKVAPGLADRYLARTGYAAQQTGEVADPDRGDNLWQPAARDYAAHGRFNDRARDWSAQLWATTHRTMLALGLGAAAIAALSWRKSATKGSAVRARRPS
jgi:NAD(P)-dependent dehydrogenase (short-subunit alcohol dehydrogenase family)